MKVMKLAVAVALSACFVTPAFASDPCESLMCMFGMMNGQNSDQCQQAEADYFSIVQWNKGNVDYDATSSARQQFLQSCPSDSGGNSSQVNSVYGKVL